MQHQAVFVPTGFGANDVQIMAGTFDEFSFDDVVQVLGLSRQCLRLMIRKGEVALSEVLLKAGQVLEARMPTSSDPDNVFSALFGTAVHGSGLSFAVYHTEPTGPFPMPRCRLQEVYERVKAGRKGAAAPAFAAPGQAAAAGQDATLRLVDVPTGNPASHVGQRGSMSGAQPFTQPGATGPFGGIPPQVTPEALGKAVVAQLQPIMREEIAAALEQLRAQVQAQAQTLNTVDGRLQSLPPLVAAELRLALAQHERNASASRPAQPEPGASRGLVAALAVGVVVLLVAVAALAVNALR
ncbi:MAG: hypothetical protein V4757_18480 [Pseudomonadota bacterium]